MARFKNRPQNREEFKEYILRRLGAPVITVEIADIQLDDVIDDALDMFNEFHHDGSFRTYRKVEITQEMIDANSFIPNMTFESETTGLDDLHVDDMSVGDTSGAGNTEYIEHQTGIVVPDDIIGVSRVLSIGGVSGANWMSGKYQYMQDMTYNLSTGHGSYSGRGTHITDYTLSMRYLEEMEFTLAYEPSIRYNKVRNRIYLDYDWAQFRAGEFLAFECFQAVDPEVYPDVWVDKFMREYSVALAEVTWGRNVGKYDGIKLPGDITMNGEQFLQRGLEKVQELEEKLKNEYQADMIPIFIG